MANNATASPYSLLPNPLTPMAFLPSDIAFQLTLIKYVYVGTLGAVIWDTIMSLGVDYRLLRDYKITLPTVVYFFSKTITLAYFILGAIFNTAPIGNCHKVFAATMWLFAIAIPSTTLLFFFRVRAVYLNNKYVVGAFALMWLGVLGGSLIAPQESSGSNIGPTKYCFSTGRHGPSLSATAIIPMINDILGFLAVTWRLTQHTQASTTFKSSFRAMVFGHYLPAFSKALLQDGQIYFLSTVGIYILTVMVLYIKGIPLAYGSILGNPNVAIMNAMACRMYRNTKLGLYRLPVPNTRPSGATSGATMSKPQPLAFHVEYTRDISTSNTVQDVESRLSGPSEKAETMV